MAALRTPSEKHDNYTSRKAGVTLLGLVSVAIALRLIWATLVPVEPISDSHAYHTFATNIATGGGYGWEPGEPSTYWAVGPSAYFAFFLRMFDTAGAAIVGNLIATAAGVFFAFAVSLRLFGMTAAIVSGALYAVWPTSIMFTTVYNSEMLFSPLLLASIWAVSSTNQSAVRGWLGGGVLFALAAYIRPVALLFPVVLGISQAVRQPNRWGTIKNALLAMLIMAMCIAPWTARNYHATGHLVVISSNAGPNLWMGNNPDSDGTYQPLPESTKGLSEVERNRMLSEEAKKFILKDPVAFVLRTAMKLVHLHSYETIGVAWNKEGIQSGPLQGTDSILKIIGSLFWWATIAGAAGGAFILFRKEGFIQLVFSPVIFSAGYLIAAQSVVVSQDRYHLQWSPLFILLSSLCISTLLTKKSLPATQETAAQPPANT